MKSLQLAVAAVLISVSLVCHAELQLGLYKKSDHSSEAILDYIAGIGSGMLWMSAAQEIRGQPPLYCAPRKVALNVYNMVGILDDYIGKHHLNDTDSIGLLMLNAYVEAFPCGQTQ